MSITRHHFVPQGYLRGFATSDDTSSNFVWVYDKRSGRTPTKKSVRSIAWTPAYYAQENPDGSEDLDKIETHLAQTIDNKIPLILGRIDPKVGRPVALSPEDKGALAFFVGLSMTRVPSFRDGINAIYSKLAGISLYHQMDSNPELSEFAKKNGLTAEAMPWVSLRPMVEMAHSIASTSLANHWQFFIPPPEVPFVTSDNPVVFSGGAAGLTQLGPAHPQAELVMNLRRNLAFVSTPKQDFPNMQVFRLSPSDARKFNRGVVRAARHRVFADHKSEVLDAFVKKYAGDEQHIVV